MRLLELIELTISNYSLKPIYVDRETDAEFFLLLKNRVLILAFNGSNNFKDWKINLSLDLVNCDRSLNMCSVKDSIFKVHRGYCCCFNNLKSYVETYINRYIGLFDEIKIIGHSSGGSVGNLFAYWLATVFNSISIKLYTFGSPPVADLKFVSISEDKYLHYRFYNLFDPTYFLFPKFLGYEDTGIAFSLFWLENPHHIDRFYINIKNSRLQKLIV